LTGLIVEINRENVQIDANMPAFKGPKIFSDTAHPKTPYTMRLHTKAITMVQRSLDE